MNQHSKSVMTSSRNMIKFAGFSVLAAVAIGFSVNAEAGECRMGDRSESRDKSVHAAACCAEGAEEKGAHRKKYCLLNGIDDAVKLLGSAQAAIEDNDLESASEEVDAAIERLKEFKGKAAEHCPVKADNRPVNTKCPMMGSEVDPDKVSEDLKLNFQDETVAFCCSPCVGAWENLSEEEKAEYLAKARENPKGHDHGDHESHHGQEACH